jgi:hypothetical protein
LAFVEGAFEIGFDRFPIRGTRDGQLLNDQTASGV